MCCYLAIMFCNSAGCISMHRDVFFLYDKRFVANFKSFAYIYVL